MTMINIEDKRMNVNTASLDPVYEEKVLQYEPFVNTDICTTRVRLIISLMVEE